MFQIDAKTFNPEILYTFDFYNHQAVSGEYHAHDFIELSIILDGYAQYQIDGRLTDAPKGTVFLFNPGTQHQDIQPADSASYQLHIGIRNVLLNGLSRNRFPFTQAKLDLGKHSADFFAVCDRIIGEKEKRYPGYEVMIKSLVTQLLLYILREVPKNHIDQQELTLSDSAREKQNLVTRVIYFLEKHHQDDLSLQKIADTFFVSPTYLSRIFKESTGETPINYLIQLRLQRAKKIIETEQVTVKEAAADVGYQDAYHFSKIFKKHYGTPPSSFQKKDDA